ncbi:MULTISPECIES: succinate dehydrogenase, cytochrome b556 subunit [Lysobacter]|nr:MULTISPECIES: succinate dehydrogenase, cytochrome b556 subunit [Lysobacter]QCW26793.1 succinate dehydrogenase, cytochrome b556 subunit [Lysobacter enzymogenes]QQQ03304.1 succinate dehydrogenase, cytochrome b556 subunit [Lysobacter enzymogenes]UZW62867.1 succinate dehydrogenase, cytochrome b556 subunit [Lysobacter enzymogenes]WMT01713.1 succinate dehydrogenase, cytochrome b556 subunit [Lysobacter yananisis]
MANRERPLSPHLQVYRWQVQMATSILHRATGVILSIGALLIAWALTALAAGPDAWASFIACARSPLGFLILFGWTWAFAYHLLNGIRHLVQDAGFGFKVQTFIRSSWTSVIGSLVLTALIWIVAMMSRGGA